MGISTHKTEWKLFFFFTQSFHLIEHRCVRDMGTKRETKGEFFFLIYKMNSMGQKVVSGKILGLKLPAMASF